MLIETNRSEFAIFSVISAETTSHLPLFVTDATS